MPTKANTFWVRPKPGARLPAAGPVMNQVLEAFYECFPEYQEFLDFSQSPRQPGYVFIFVKNGCSGVWNEATEFLSGLLTRAFPQGDIRVYGREWG